MATVSLKKTLDNPYRDRDLFPLNEAKLLSLEESVESTGFWDNLICRPKDNKIDGKEVTPKDLEAYVADGFNFANIEVEIAYGHHRVEVLRRLKWKTMDIPVKVISDDQMLLIMANENKEGWGDSIANNLETFRQVRNQIENMVAPYKTFTEYKKDGGTFFTDSKSFKKAKAAGIGFRTVKKFLGKTWSETTLRYAARIIACVDAGYFDQEDIIDLPSIGITERICAIAEFLYEGNPKKEIAPPAMPEYWRRDIVDRCIELSKADSSGWAKVTVAQLKRALNLLVSDGINPASYLKSGSTKGAFNIVKATKELVFDPDKSEEEVLQRCDDLKEKDGFEGYADIDNLVDEVKEACRKAFSQLRGKDDDDPEDDLKPMSEEELQRSLDEAAEDVNVPDMFSNIIPEDVEDEDYKLPIGHLVETWIQTAQHLNKGTADLIERIEEVPEHADFDATIEMLCSSVLTLARNRMAREDLIALAKQAIG